MPPSDLYWTAPPPTDSACHLDTMISVLSFPLSLFSKLEVRGSHITNYLILQPQDGSTQGTSSTPVLVQRLLYF